jgi:hypothetical protein
MTHRVGMVRRKGHLIRKNQTTVGIKDPSTRRRLHLKNEKAAGRIFGKTLGLQIARRIAGSSVPLRKIRDWTLYSFLGVYRPAHLILLDCIILTTLDEVQALLSSSLLNFLYLLFLSLSLLRIFSFWSIAVLSWTRRRKDNV